jgi:hypothetical protein
VFHYPTLSLFEVEQILEFYQANKQAVLDYVSAYKEELKHLEAMLPKGPSRSDLLDRFDAVKRDRAGSGSVANQG